MRVAHRTLGLDLAGAKNFRTTLAILESYPKEKKVFLLDVYDQLGAEDGKNSDESLVEFISTHVDENATLGTSAPLTFPPALGCTCKKCQPGKCKSPASKWTQSYLQKISRKKRNEELPKLREFTPYTQRPVEIWARYEILPRLPPSAMFEVDEALGGNKAPLTARMIYLSRFLEKLECIEVWPKLSAWAIARALKIPMRILTEYRSLDQGSAAREEFMDAIAREGNVFIYEKDARKLTQSLPAFDAFLCAYTALLNREGHCLEPPRGFPKASGWIAIPSLLEGNR